MQRVGRVNRVDTKFSDVYTFNFFPTKQANDEIKLREAAESKISAFIQMLGADARLLTDGEDIESFTLFNRLLSTSTLTGDGESEDSELRFLQVIRNVRDKSPDLFARIKRLPKKARSARVVDEAGPDGVLTYFRKGRLHKFYLACSLAPEELDFFTAAGMLEAQPDAQVAPIGGGFYEMLARNKEAFRTDVAEPLPDLRATGGRDTATKLLRLLRSREMRLFPTFTDDDETYLRHLTRLVEESGLPSHTAKKVMKAIGTETSPMRVLSLLRLNIPRNLFVEVAAQSSARTAGPREVILSEYFARPANG
jgi:hypothetical protein